MLDRQVITVPFVGGPDTKSDSKQIVPTKLTTLENGVFTSPKKIRKRFGYTNLNVQGLSGQVIDGGFAYHDSVLVFDGGQAHSFSQANKSAVSNGNAISASLSLQTVIKDNFIEASPDMATLGGIDVYAFESVELDQSAQFVSCSLIDHNTGAIYQNRTTLQFHNQNFNPRVIGIASTGIAGIFSASFTGSAFAGISVSTVNVATPTALPAHFVNIFPAAANVAVPPAGYPTQNRYFDAIVDKTGTRALVVYFAGASTINVALVNLSGTPAVSLSTSLNIGAGWTFLSAISVVYDANSDRYLITYAGEKAGGSYVNNRSLLPSDLSEPGSEGSVVAASPRHFTNIGNCYNPINGYITLLLESASAVPDTSKKLRRVDSYALAGQTVSFTGPSWPGLALASEPFFVFFGAVGFVYVNLVFDSPVQPTQYLLQLDATLNITNEHQWSQVSRFVRGNSGGVTFQNSRLPAVVVSGSNAFFPCVSKTIVIGGVAALGISRTEVQFLDRSRNYGSSFVDQDAIISGLPFIYDGKTVVEQGFNQFPEITLANAPGGALSAGTYEYFAVYEWFDAQGQRHQSSPSIGKSIAVNLNDKVTVTYDMLHLTKKTSFGCDVWVSVYRTLVNGTVAHKLPFIGALPSESNLDTGTGVDTFSDAQISSEEILYTTGDVLPNDPALSSSFMETYKNRVFLGGLEDPNTIAYSKGRVAPEPVAFSDDLTIQVSSKYGGVTAFKAMDDKFIVFTRSGNIFYMYGEGPDDTGQNNNFSTLQEIISPVGCFYPKSIVQIPTGIIFKSDKGIWLLNRSLQVSYIGADVEAYNSLNITSAVLLADQNQVRFMTDGFLSSNPICLVYDYYIGQWSVFTNLSGYGATIFQGKYLFFDLAAQFQQETAGLFTESLYNDSSTTLPISLKIGTAWIRLGDLQGFQRVRRANFLGSLKSSHLMTISLAYDYASSFSNTMTFVPTSDPEQFRMHMPRQKCEAIRFQFQDSFPGSPGEGYDLSGLSLEIGVKRGVFKLPAAQSTG